MQVPAWCCDAKDSLNLFNEIFPAFHYLGDEIHIHPDVPFDMEGDIDVQLVCKYLKAYRDGKLDYWHKRMYNYTA